MSILSEAKAILEADTTLEALATGGIWDADELGSEGLNRTSNPSAFDAFRRIKPAVILAMRQANPDGQLRDDEAGKLIGTRQVLECWLYQHTGYAAIEAMEQRIYSLLQGERLSNTWPLTWTGNVRPPVRDTDLNATVQRSDYLARYIRSG